MGPPGPGLSLALFWLESFKGIGLDPERRQKRESGAEFIVKEVPEI